MAYEDRLRALEDEFKVLKNEIQATLLDIQKEILKIYYRPTSAETPAPSPPSPQSRPGRAFSDIADWRTYFTDEENDILNRLLDESPDSRDSIAGLAARRHSAETREPRPSGEEDPLDELLRGLESVPDISRENIHVDEEDGQPRRDVSRSTIDAISRSRSGRRDRGEAHGYLKDEALWTAVTRLFLWVRESVRDIGRRRTARAIDMYARNGYMSPGMQQVLLTLTSFMQDGPGVKEANVRRIIETFAKLNGILSDGKQRVDLNQILTFIEEDNLDE
jgi:hypothetical protein